MRLAAHCEMAAHPVPSPNVVTSIVDTIGNTPLLRLDGFDTGPCELYLKLELLNPTGSIKDRVAHAILVSARTEGVLGPGQAIVEATAGNTGLALALLAARRGHPLALVIPDRTAREKIVHLRALGAEVILTRSDVGKGHPEHYQSVAASLARERGAYFPNQFENPANPRAHEEGTGAEIFAQLEGSVDAVVVGVGSGGTLGGLTRFFSRAKRNVRMVLADPAGSSLAARARGETSRAVTRGSWLVEGIGGDAVPKNADFSLVRETYEIEDRASFATAHELLRLHGVFAGPSTGTLLAAALRYCRSRTNPERVVTFACDSGTRYLSTLYDDAFLREQGFVDANPHGDLRDLLGDSPDPASTFVRPKEPLTRAFALMKRHDLTQLPVVRHGRVIGYVDESVLLRTVGQDPARFSAPVRSVMSTSVAAFDRRAPIDELLGALRDGLVPLVFDGERFLGLVSRAHLLRHLRRRVA